MSKHTHYGIIECILVWLFHTYKEPGAAEPADIWPKGDNGENTVSSFAFSSNARLDYRHRDDIAAPVCIRQHAG